MIHSITPFLWFDGNAEAAARFYTSIFPDASLDNVSPMMVTFTLQGQQFHGLNGGPEYTHSPAVSFFVRVDTQLEVDHLWNALTAEGGQPGRCGWLVDKSAFRGKSYRSRLVR
jgi:predicted 3-demethylubiquinone-9 3-methyltransferase (glyoxalase superfamily)